MIVVYPMLTSDAVSQNVLPGICKALEKFIIVYRLDTVLKRVDTQVNLKFSIKGKHIQVKENIDLTEANGSKKYAIDPNTGLPVPKSNDNKVDKNTVNVSGFQQKADASIGKPAEAKIMYPPKDSISLEPTYITVNTKSGPALIGVKVVPFPIKTKGANIVELMNNDRQMKSFESVIRGMGRWVIRVMHGAWRGTIGRFPLLNRTISGDPKQDILYASSQFGVETFILMTMMDIKETFLKSPSLIKKLHYMGWRSFAVADEVNRKVSFCMKEFGGICNMIPYSYLFSSLGKEHATAFNDLEDVKKSTAAFFKQRIPRKKLLGEQLALAKLEKKKLTESDIVLEGLFDFLKKNKSEIKSMNKKVEDSANKLNFNVIENVINKMPSINLSKIKDYGKKKSPDFDKSYNISKRVVDNSLPELNKDVRDHVSTMIAFKSISRSDGNIDSRTREELKTSLPIIMRAVKVGAGTSLKLVIWGFIVSTGFINMPITLTVIIYIILKGIYKFAKGEENFTQIQDKHRRKLEVMAMDAAKERSKVKVPYVNVQTISTTGGE